MRAGYRMCFHTLYDEKWINKTNNIIYKATVKEQNNNIDEKIYIDAKKLNWKIDDTIITLPLLTIQHYSTMSNK